jgi:MinD superfamily P-loop ATPase
MTTPRGGRQLLAIASGKGGTGKTTVATSLATVLSARGHAVTYVDCDVEEPNGHIFLQPVIDRREPVSVLVPRIDDARCTLCGECARICRFHALARVNGTILTFPQLCHACGGCALVCPSDAVTEVRRPVGFTVCGRAGTLGFLAGELSVGEAMATPVIRAVKRRLPDEGLVILDSPPGTSCPVVETIRDADAVILVTEPTPFGLNDLELAVTMTRALGIPTGVVVNRSDVGDGRVVEYCTREGLSVLLQIPNDLGVARVYARGLLPVNEMPRYRRAIEELGTAVVGAGWEASLR